MSKPKRAKKSADAARVIGEEVKYIDAVNNSNQENTVYPFSKDTKMSISFIKPENKEDKYG